MPGAGLEVLEWGEFGDVRTLSAALPRLKASSFDETEARVQRTNLTNPAAGTVTPSIWCGWLS